MYLWRRPCPQSRSTDHSEPLARRRFVQRLLLCCLSTLVLLNGMLASATVRAESTVATATAAAFGLEYAVPNGPRNIVEETPDRIWYTATDAGGIGVVEVISDTATLGVRYRTDFYGLGENSLPYDLDYYDGAVWFTVRGLRSIGRIDTMTREIKTYVLETVGAAPTTLDVAPDGMVWIGQNNGRIARFNPVTEEIDEYLLPDHLAAAPRIEDIVYRTERNIWFTMPEANYVVNYDSVRDRFFEVATGELQPTKLDFDGLGRLWVTAAGTSKVGLYVPTTVSTWFWYEPPTLDSAPVGILTFNDAQGALQVWITENRFGSIGRLQFANNFDVATREKLGPNTPAGNTWDIIRASDGDIWVADLGRNLLYEIREPYIHRVYLASVANQVGTGAAIE